MWLRGLYSVRNHETPAHRPRNHTYVCYTTQSICISSNAEASKELLDDGRVLPKEVGASIWIEGVLKISAYCWLFLLRLILLTSTLKPV
jgi:hypothetical protein